MKKIEEFTIQYNDTIFSALNKINNNQKGFLIVLHGDSFTGTLTDGDIRRALLSGAVIDSSIEDKYFKDSTILKEDDSFGKAIDLFKDGKISFIPVIRENGQLFNIVTKAAMHALLLQEIYPSLAHDFINVDETLAEHEIFGRPWGFYKTTMLNEKFRSKIISVRPGQALSLQQHKLREEHWLIAKGKGLCRVDDNEFMVSAGDTINIPKMGKHRIENLSKGETLIILELQIGDYFGEDDIIRLEDKYGRI